ncbi:MAG: chemotaxis protein CheD [Desulfuromonadales bacterium]|nr:chemotaxis protein CheD [Desulfuromonadales bacterium]
MSEHFLYPGMLFAEQETHRVTTVLGSCIAVCLYDPIRRIGGINHYMLPLWNGEGLPTPRYGNVAIIALIERLQKFGCLTTRMQAKLFGGAAMWDNGNSFVSVGERNINQAWLMLERYEIPVVAQDLGGSASRKIIFYSETGEVLLRRQHSTFQSERRSGDEIAVSGQLVAR